MPPQKPLPISSDDLPDKAITRDKLGQGSIIQHFLSNGNANWPDATDTYLDLINNGQLPAIDPTLLYPMAFSGRVKKIVMNINNNSLTGDLQVMFNIDGIDGSSKIIKSTDTGILVLEFDEQFNQNSKVCVHIKGNNAGQNINALYQIITECDG